MSTSDPKTSTDDSPPDSPSRTEASGPDPEATTCPGCGHRFTGNYCPKCGQEADPTISPVRVIGGFLRDLINLDSGLWPTLRALTLRPGATLSGYLQGDRRSVMNPGRYLLAMLVFNATLHRALYGFNILQGPEMSSAAEATDGQAKALVAAAQDLLALDGMGLRPVLYLLVAGLLALNFRRLFWRQLASGAEALAVGSFLLGHVVFLGMGLEAVVGVSTSLWTGQPADPAGTLLLMLAYTGWAAYACFGPGWQAALQGAAGMALTVLDTACIFLVGLCLYGAWLFTSRPGAFGAEPSAPEVLLVLAATGAVPLGLHAGFELYSRLR